MGVVWPMVRLIWAPRSLAEAALRTPTWTAYAAGVPAGATIGATLLLAIAMGIDEPYPTFNAYLGQPWNWSALSVIGAIAGLGGALALLPVAVLAEGARTLREKASIRAVLLSPLSCVAPLVAWCALGVIARAGDNIIGGGPAWTRWPPFLILGSCWWALLFLVLYAWLMRHASYRLGLIFSPSATTCPACLYDLSGLEPDAVCPECGRVRSAEQAPSRE